MLGADARVEKLVVDALERAALGCRLAPSDEAHRAVLEGALQLLRALAARDVHVEHEPEGTATLLLTHARLRAECAITQRLPGS